MATPLDALIDRERQIINDPAGLNQTFQESEIAAALDRYRLEVWYHHLTPIYTYTSTGVQVTRFESTLDSWSSDATVVDGSYADITSLLDVSTDYVLGVWVFTNPRPSHIVMVSGKTYDLWATAADLCEEWVSKIKLQYDFGGGGTFVYRSSRISTLLELADSFRQRARALPFDVVRTDERAHFA